MKFQYFTFKSTVAESCGFHPTFENKFMTDERKKDTVVGKGYTGKMV